MSSQSIREDSLEVSDEAGEEGSSLPESYIVIRISPNIQPNTLEWLVEKINGKRRDGGAELIVMKQPYNEENGIVLHISVSKIKLLEAAEEMEIIKKDINGQQRDFTVSELEEFLHEGMRVEDLFTTAEKQTIVHHELENIRALAEDSHIPGYPSFTLYEGQSILQVCMKWKLVFKVYALHDSENLKKLGKKWYLTMFKEQPIEDIRTYFGEAVALYFTFLGYYTMALLIPMCLGFLQILVSMETVPFFCIFNVVWVTVFLEVWRRRSNELAFTWGTIGMTSQSDEPRPNFRGHMGIDAVTGRVCPQYPRWKTNVKMYCVSFPIVILCMICAFIVMLSAFYVEDYLRQNDMLWAVQIPSVVYTALVYGVNLYYRNLATFLTEWENHRTQSQYDRHRVSKLVLFEFVNNFMSLFYIAFVIQDMDMLRTQLATMLIITQALNNLQEAIVPFMLKYYSSKINDLKNFFSNTKLNTAKPSQTKQAQTAFVSLKLIPEIHPDDPRITEANKEGEMEAYEGTYDDYLEMFIQFGYVLLFSSVYPIAAFWAVCNNILEIRSDAFKLCMVYQRPLSRRVKDIGAWLRAFEILGALSIMTNCGLLCLSPPMRRRGPDLSQAEWIMMFVLLEHLLLGLRYLLHIAIPEKPEWVRVALAKRNYQSKQALKHEDMRRKNVGLQLNRLIKITNY